jgi:hypothetical protein
MSKIKVTPNYDKDLELVYKKKLEELLPEDCNSSVMSYLVEHEDEVNSFVNIDIVQNGKMHSTSVHSLPNLLDWLGDNFNI